MTHIITKRFAHRFLA